MKVFVALLALVAVTAANPLPVQLIVNINAPADTVSPTPVIVDKPKPIVPGLVNIVDNVDVEPIIFPEPILLPHPVLPVVVEPEPVVLPAPVLPEVVPEEVIVEVPSVPAGIVTSVETITPEEVIICTFRVSQRH